MNSSAIRVLQVDAFTDRPFAGNPAAVCLLEDKRDAAWMQAVAAEMNLSETAFVRPLADGHELRWFTPAIEVELCGHATLASAHALWSESVVDAGTPIRFHTKSGVLTWHAKRRLDRTRFSRDSRRAGRRSSRGASRCSRRHSFLCRPVEVRQVRASRIRGGGPLVETGFRAAAGDRDARRDGHELVRRSSFRFHLALLRSRRRNRRRPRHRISTLLLGPVLERTSWQDPDDGLSGFGSWRNRPRASERRSSHPRRPGGYRAERRIGMSAESLTPNDDESAILRAVLTLMALWLFAGTNLASAQESTDFARSSTDASSARWTSGANNLAACLLCVRMSTLRARSRLRMWRA